ncbi:MAG TPA: hydrogenase maturation nickel metallochaperone HypA [Synergistetes bacterium]|nr:hydrogenase maturation nickel metallochaperone HypA [Synergistota bacterium]
MHELSLVKALVDLLEKEAREKNWGRVTKVTLRIGSMRQVIPDVMAFSFDIATKESPMEGAELEMLELPVELRCRSCGKEWEKGPFLCPHCGSSDVEIRQGMELEIESVEVEDQDAPKDQHTQVCNGG